MLLYPPWSATGGGQRIYLGYSPLFGHAARVSSMHPSGYWGDASVDTSLVLLQWFLVALVTATTIVTLKAKGYGVLGDFAAAGFTSSAVVFGAA